MVKHQMQNQRYMMSQNDLISLYSTRLLTLASEIPYLGRLPHPQASATRQSPVCGSGIIVDIVLSNGRVEKFAQDVSACALGSAAASITGTAVIGRTPSELMAARDELYRMLQGDGQVPCPPFDGYHVLLPARSFKNRHASIFWAIEAATEAALEANKRKVIR